ncbi:MAG TPA: hypothetical protein PLL69_00110 [Gemmatimonadales bacterium]|nr:hypothetical protein [Gemmatimonadales bacterium]
MSGSPGPLEEIDRAERLAWRIQRASWLLAGLLLLPAALLGAFGAGWLATARQDSGGGSLLYERVMRVGVAREWELRIPATNDIIEVRFGHLFLDTFHVGDWAPLPEPATSTGTEFIAAFTTQPPGVFRLRFRAVPRAIGLHSIVISTGASRWNARVLVLP